MNKFYAMLLMSALSVPAFALTPFHKGRTPRPAVSRQVIQRVPQLETVVEEDFSKFSAGSETEPAAEIEYGSKGYDVPETLTAQPGWTAQGLHPAGGCVALYPWETSYGDTRGGYISIPPMYCGGTVTITLRAKRLGTEAANLWVALCDEYYGPKTGVDEGDFILTDEWQTCTVVATAGSFDNNAYFQIMATEGKALVDDVKVTFIANRLPAPMIESHANVAPGSFAVEWEDTGADKYLYSLKCLSEPAVVNRGTLTCDFDGVNVNADGTTINVDAPGYPEGWSIDVSSNGAVDITRDEGTFSSAPQAIVFDAVDDVITSPDSPESITEIRMHIGLSQEDDDEYSNSLLSVEIWHADTQTWESIANLNYWYIQQYSKDGVSTFDSNSIQSEDVTRVRFTMVQKGLINFYIDDIEIDYKTRRDISYVAQDVETAETQASFDGLDVANDYYFTVKAVKDGVVSDPSQEVWVDGVQDIMPEAPEISNVTRNSFTASWKPVGKADTYLVGTWKIVNAEADMPKVVVLEENFDGIDEGTVEMPGTDWMTPFDFSSRGWTATPWCATQAAWAAGMAGSQGTSWYGTAGLVFSPRLNLSANGGEFDIDFTVYTTVDKVDFGGDYGVVDESIFVIVMNQYFDQQGLAAYELATPEVGSHKFSITFANPDKLDFSDVIVAFMTKTGKAFFIDDVKITQNLKAGDHLMVPYSVQTTPETSIDFSGLEEGCDYGVMIAGSLTKDYTTYLSKTSEMVIAKTSEASGSLDAVDAATDVTIEGGVGHITLAAPAEVTAEICNVNGVRVATVKGSATVKVNAGIYIVKVAAKTVKLAVR